MELEAIVSNVDIDIEQDVDGQRTASSTINFLSVASWINILASLAFDVNGFSHSTCLPATNAFRAHSKCMLFGNEI